jgi:hypothetical protein
MSGYVDAVRYMGATHESSQLEGTKDWSENLLIWSENWKIKWFLVLFKQAKL